MKKSLLFVIPDYHNSFILRNELRRRGWRADIYVPYWYPKDLLFADDAILYKKPKWFWLLRIKNFLYLLLFLFRYKYFLIYSADTVMPLHEEWLQNFIGKGFRLDLSLLKLFRKKLIFIPSGCRQIETKKNFSKIDQGKVCGNCGWSEKECHDEKNENQFAVIRRYMDVNLGFMLTSSQYKQTAWPYKVMDLNKWRPDLEISAEYKLEPTKNLRILHSFYSKDRGHAGKNIKGSPHVLDAIERLKNEGYAVEYYFLSNTPSRLMRYYQAQADIVVDQLIYGWWGSTSIEAMALGKPVVCYINPDWKKNFLSAFPSFRSLPFIEANTETVYEVLKELVTNPKLRAQQALESRTFAEQFYNIQKNTDELEKILYDI